ncbi:hypothetical protein [Polaribacter cellanae]|uniref:Uncharacterized protein n=1 Tax=Polaribacter cellanae TaxID=2818493 RepID=A0A975CPG2_9FLAO|nr:hypothetical protein [Polaribacter cellanae]QTE23348.1 hypothetical protein J3359_03450 [Polaribacter cellanae]
MRKILLLIIISLILMGCPPAHFYKYKPVNRATEVEGFYLIAFSDNYFKIRVGYLNSFIKKKERKVVVIINPNNSNVSKTDFTIKSIKLGKLNYIKTERSLLFYEKEMPYRREAKNLNFIEGDTIKILMKKNKMVKHFKFYYGKH